MTKRFAAWAFGVAILAAASTAAAAPGPRAYAVVVGSNPGGAGQATLEFAERDARSVATLLADIGGYERDDVYLLTRPSPAKLLATLEDVAAKIRADAAAGRQSVLLFYYSGHARAKSLNLGADELALDRLRSAIVALPATLRIVILDACQSGAFSKIKGASPAADFSFNSVSRLNSAGVAVMASSSATELSQESKQLRSSYFTHHLIVALRGAGDANGDGRVSLDEAYKYAYDRTLVSTAKTAVGKQHVTLETDLKGKGEVALTYPARADAHLVLPERLVADVLVQQRNSGTVVAEVHKARGAVRLALPTGKYRVIARVSDKAKQCDLRLARGAAATLQLNTCRDVELRPTVSKGAPGQWSPPLPKWSVEAAFGFGFGTRDAYTDTLETFGYEEDFFVPIHYSLSVGYRLTPYLFAVGSFARLDSGEWRRRGDSEPQTFSWTTHGLSASLRAAYPVGNGLLVPFAEAGAGVTHATTTLHVSTMSTATEHHWGYQVAATGGAYFMPWTHFGFFGKGTYSYAPTIDNLQGQTHNAGGAFVSVGVRGTF